MPLYDFRCQTCGVFEQRCSIAEASKPVPCPTCQAVAKRIISAVGVVKTPSAISRRVEQGAEPRVQHALQHDHSHHKHGHNQHCGRPWAIGH